MVWAVGVGDVVTALTQARLALAGPVLVVALPVGAYLGWRYRYELEAAVVACSRPSSGLSGASAPVGPHRRHRSLTMPLNDAAGNQIAMTTLYDVPADDLIEAAAVELADENEIAGPDWAEFAKTGNGRELPPEQDDFWQRRAASLLRKVAVDGPVGVNSLRTEYGGSKKGSNRYQVRPPQKSQASGNVIRTALQQLEEVGYIEAAGGEGRRVSSEGTAFLDELAGDVLQDLDRPELERYA